MACVQTTDTMMIRAKQSANRPQKEGAILASIREREEHKSRTQTDSPTLTQGITTAVACAQVRARQILPLCFGTIR